MPHAPYDFATFPATWSAGYNGLAVRTRREGAMNRVKLDSIDRKILRDLQANGRVTNVELARRVGISAPPCLRRVRALEEAGYIRGYHAELDPTALGFNMTVFAQVGLSSQAERDLVAFEKLVDTWPEVRECHMLAGETDFLLKVTAADWEEYQTFVTTKLTPAPNVSHVKSALAIRSSKLAPGVPVYVTDDDGIAALTEAAAEE
jgi:DNA-binding Lrp family transcriptional regulator